MATQKELAAQWIALGYRTLTAIPPTRSGCRSLQFEPAAAECRGDEYRGSFGVDRPDHDLEPTRSTRSKLKPRTPGMP
jgi:hypothetical protein